MASLSLLPKPRVSVRPPVGPRVLVIDDDAMLRRALVRSLKRRYEVTERDSAEVALNEIAKGERYDAIICDLNLGGMSGRQFLLELHAQLPELAAKVIILSGTSKLTLDEAVLQIIENRFVEKPATLGEIELIIGDVIAVRAAA